MPPVGVPVMSKVSVNSTEVPFTGDTNVGLEGRPEFTYDTQDDPAKGAAQTLSGTMESVGLPELLVVSDPLLAMVMLSA